MSVKAGRNRTLGMSPDKLVASLGVITAARKGLIEAAEELEATWKQVLSQPGTGRIYQKGGKRHRASAPNNPPAVDSNGLRESITHVVVGDGLRVRVGTPLRYGLALEYGVNVSGSQVGPHPSANYRLQPRPHARPARDAANEDMKKAMRVELRNAKIGAL